MKKRLGYVLSIAALSIVLAGCTGNSGGAESPTPTGTQTASPSASSTPDASETPSAAPEDTDDLILKQFQDIALASPPADELMASFDELIKQVQPAKADEFIRTLETYYESNLLVVEGKFEDNSVQEALRELGWPIKEAQVDEIADEDVRTLVQQTQAGGYKLITSEGYIFPIVDYDKLLDYGDRVTTGMKTYLDLMASESNAPAASDGGLIISWEELSSRALAAESYVVAFPDSPERQSVEDRFIHYLNMYLIGLPNTPIFDYSTMKVDPDVKAKFEQLAADHGETITGQLTKELLAILEQTKGAVFTKGKDGEQIDIPETKKFRDELESFAREALPPSKS